jgi:hypothetical protein
MMLSTDIIHLLSPKFKDDTEIDLLYNKIVETVCLHEGMFPISEATICWHQLIDIPLHIKKFGPIKCWWEFSGERSLSSIKRHIPDGGISPDKSVMRSYSKKENNDIQNNFKIDKSNNINNVDNFSLKNGCLQYSDEKFLLQDKIDLKNKKRYNELKFNSFELENLIDELISEVKKQCRNRNEAYFKSPLYRMYVSYLTHKVKMENISFYDFLIECLNEDGELYTLFAIEKEASSVFKQYFEMQDNEQIETDGKYIKEDLKTVKILLFMNLYHTDLRMLLFLVSI